MRKRHVPIKALILDQAVISGVGNWVADESLYHARLHPEQYCDEFSDAEIKRLYECIRYVCQTAVDLLGDSDQFPEHWLFNYRWGKGKKEASALPNGEKLAFITVGGRTSCYAPSIQKKTGQVVSGIKEEPLEIGDAAEQPKKGRAKKVQTQSANEDNEKPKKVKGRKLKSQDPGEEEEAKQPRKKAKVKQEVVEKKETPKTKPAKTNGTEAATDPDRRRSARLSRGP